MAKVKVTLKSSAGARKKTASSSSRKPNTPTKVARGKVGKPPRPNIKGESTSSSLSLDLNKYYEIQSQTRLCFVNIKRDTSIFNSSVDKSSSVTLQAQCTDTSSAVGCNKENTVETDIHSEKASSDTTVAGQALTNSEQKQTNVVNESNSAKNKNVSENIKDVSCASPPNASNAQRRCNIKIKRIALNVAQNESTAQDKDKSTAEKIPPTGAKKCLVKLYKLPMVPKSISTAEELYAIAEKEDEILASSLSQIENPVVDQEKRKAFLKLALPKSKNGKFAAEENSHQEKNSDNVEQISKNTVPRTMEFPDNIKDLNVDKISQNIEINDSTKTTDLTKKRIMLSLNSVRSVRNARNKAAANENQLSEINKNKNCIDNSSQNMENISISSKTSESSRMSNNSAVNSVSALKNTRNEGSAKENELPEMNKSNDLNVDIISKRPENLTNSKTTESTKASKKLPINSVIAFRNTRNKTSAKAKELPEMNKNEDLNVNNISNNTSKTNSLNSVRILNTGRKAPSKEKELQKMNKSEDIIGNNMSNNTGKLITSKTNSLNSVRTFNTRSKVPPKVKELQEMNKNEDVIVNNISNRTEKLITSKTNSLAYVRTFNTRSKVPAKAQELQEMNKSDDVIVNNISNNTEKLRTSKTNSLNSVRSLNTKSGAPSGKAKELPEVNKSEDIIVYNMSNNTEKLITSKTNSLNSVRTSNTRSKAPAKAKELPEVNKNKSNDPSNKAKKLITSKTNTFRTLNTKTKARAKSKELPETNESKGSNAEILENKKKTNSSKMTEISESSKNKPLNPIIKTAVEAKELPMTNKIVDLKRIHFVPQKNSTMHFEHFRNSKDLELFNDHQEEDNNNNNKSNNDNNNNQEKENGEKNNDYQINPSKSMENKTTTSPDKNNKIHKFFHRNNDQISIQSPQQKIRRLLSVKRMSPLSKKNRFLSKRSSQIRREHVYDFLSQSQTSDSDGNSGKVGAKPVDPMADVIKKLIEQGKVTLATNQKGRGRPKLKPNKALRRNVNRVTKKKGTVKPKKGEKTNAKKVMTIPPPIAEEGNVVEDDDHHHHDYDDNLDNFDGDNDDNVDYNMNKPSNQQAIKNFPHQMVSEQEGTFSNLAKSVLINQAGRSGAQRIKAQRLLAMAKKIISTPKNNKNVPSLQASLDLDFSPIHPPMPKKRPPTKPSPWRVDEDAHLPRVFNFSRSSSNLPSFSSDFIPPTPRKETPKNKTLYASNATPTVDQHAQSSPMPSMQSMAALPANQVSTPLVNNQNFSVPSSFSSNDSNAENQPPPKTGPPDKSPNENANIFDLKQLPNPRRTLTYRSPLKAINILEVVHLPPIANLKAAHAAKGKETETTQMEMFGFEELAANDTTFKSPQKPKTPSNKKSKRRLTPEKDLFGFEEFLSQTDASSQESQVEQQSREVSPNKTIHDKLQGLRRLRPASAELEFNLQQPQTNIAQKVPNLFNDTAHITKPQKTIQQMLCSTMIEKPSTSKRALEELNRRNLQKPREAFNGATNANSNISELFKDPEPETTFNEEDPHRTYIRPYKRKRRLRENKLVLVYDSDESWDGDNSSPKKKKRGGKHQNHQHSHETDTSSEQKGNKRKRQCKEKPELKNFVEEFQEMCKEVDSYELIVEKSA